jgi:ABC-type multidrug transport system fused ATPase/permease subunit
VISGYAKREKFLFFSGMFLLLLGQLSDLSIPAFIGIVINYLVDGKYTEIYKLCVYLLILVCVSLNCGYNLLIQFSLPASVLV